MPAKPKTKEWDPNLLPLIKTVLGKKGIEQRQAAEADRKKVDYFRGKDFTDWLLKNDTVTKRRCPKALDEYLSGKGVADEEDVAVLGQALLDKGFIASAVYAPLIEKKEETASDRKKKKWPDRLKRQNLKFDTQGFYIVVWEGSHGFRYLMLSLMVTCIVAGTLFPVWPIWARIFAWYIALAFCTLYFVIEFVRNTCFALGWIVGVDFWILPNFNDEYCSFVDSFKPIYSFERRKDTITLLISRAVVLFITVACVEELSKTHSISDVTDFVKGSYQDIIEWGENKALMLEGGGERMKLPSVDELLKEEAEEAEREKTSTTTTASSSTTMTSALGARQSLPHWDGCGRELDQP
ncbi:unnamed protein product [Amoebophrya sp. A120]|nr:unnamed protein product [Amoebophrya sp. A120]|eukprot:GSA120T00024360001.1